METFFILLYVFNAFRTKNRSSENNTCTYIHFRCGATLFFFIAASYMCCTHTRTRFLCVWAFSFIFRYIPKAQCKIVYSYITSESIQELLARYTEARNSTDGQTDTQIKQKYNIYFEYGKAVDATLVSMIIPVGWLDGRVLLECIVFVFTGQIRKILFKYLRSLHATDERICYASVPYHTNFCPANVYSLANKRRSTDLEHMSVPSWMEKKVSKPSVKTTRPFKIIIFSVRCTAFVTLMLLREWKSTVVVRYGSCRWKGGICSSAKKDCLLICLERQIEYWSTSKCFCTRN